MVATYTNDTRSQQEEQAFSVDPLACHNYIQQLQTEAYVQQLYAKIIDPDQVRPTFEPELLNIICSIEKTAQQTGRIRNVRTQIENSKKSVPAFAALCQEPEQQAEEKTNKTDQIMPALEWGLLNPKLGIGVSQWFDDYVAFSKKWSPRACAIQHKGCALWILSTIAARRVAAEYGGLQYTPLYIALVAPSTVYAKTITAKIATDVISQAGFDWVLGSNSTTPERLLSNMAGKFIPANWEELSTEEKKVEEKRLAHSGQLGWYYSELGQLIREMADDKGRNAAFKSLLQRMDDGENSYSYDTHKRGKERIQNPYMAFFIWHSLEP